MRKFSPWFIQSSSLKRKNPRSKTGLALFSRKTFSTLLKEVACQMLCFKGLELHQLRVFLNLSLRNLLFQITWAFLHHLLSRLGLVSSLPNPNSNFTHHLLCPSTQEPCSLDQLPRFQGNRWLLSRQSSPLHKIVGFLGQKAELILSKSFAVQCSQRARKESQPLFLKEALTQISAKRRKHFDFFDIKIKSDSLFSFTKQEQTRVNYYGELSQKRERRIRKRKRFMERVEWEEWEE